MLIGVPKETKDSEGRVALTPAGAQELSEHGHRVLVEKGAGRASGFSDEQFLRAGATIASRAEVFQEVELIVKVKEPVVDEPELLRQGQVLFSYLHLAAERELTKRLLDRQIIGLAYETVRLVDGALPLLSPMSAVAGRLAVQVGATYLQANGGGRGILLGGVPGVSPAEVLILGAGTAGINALQIALGMGANVTVIERDLRRVEFIDQVFKGRVVTLASSSHSVAAAVAKADLLIGAVLLPGATAPRLVSREMVQTMKPGSVVVDIAIDQGGCVETIHPTRHSDPVFLQDEVIHYGVTNIPALTPRTSTFALTNATLPYIVAIADDGVERAMRANPALAKGLNLYRGQLTCEPVAASLGLSCVNWNNN